MASIRFNFPFMHFECDDTIYLHEITEEQKGKGTDRNKVICYHRLGNGLL